MSSYWPTLGQYVEALDKAGKLTRVTVPINKDTELHPLVRLQFRGLPESERKAFLFENVVDGRGRRYDIPVLVGALAGSAEIYALGMGCKLDEIEEVWRKALAQQIAPVEVSNPACQQIVIRGEELSREGLEVEVVDLRTVKPLDTDTVLASVARTGRLLCVGESFPWGGTTAEVVARVASQGFHLLDAAPQRLNARDTPIPYHPNLWSAHRPNAKNIVAKARALLRE